MSENADEGRVGAEAPEEPQVEKALGTGAREAVGGDMTRSYVPDDDVVSPNATIVTGDVVAGDPETHDDQVEAPDTSAMQAPAESSAPAHDPEDAPASSAH
jgi:hypothetical protein